MTMQTTGAITLLQIQNEFGGTNPIALSEYYRGGTYVPNSVTSLPTQGSISLSNFYGTSLGPPAVTSLILTAQVNNSTHIVTFYAQVNVSRINDTGGALSYTVNIENSTDQVNFYYFGTQLTLTVPSGQNYGSTTIQLSQTGTTGSPLTQYSRQVYQTIVSNTTSGWQEKYYIPLAPASLSVSVYNPPVGPGTVSFDFIVNTNYINETGTAQSFTLDIYNIDSPDLLGSSTTQVIVPNGAQYGISVVYFNRVNLGYNHPISSYTGYGGLTSNTINWIGSY